MSEKLLIPAALQVCLDDVGWWCGRDDRKIGGPSRTGFVRDHCALDYRAIHELGKAIDQKIFCAFVMGEWDMDDRLGREVPYFSHFGDKWNNSAYRDKAQMEEAVDIVNSSDYIDICIHGLYHGYYKDGNFNKDTSDYYFRPERHVLEMIPEEEVKLLHREVVDDYAQRMQLIHKNNIYPKPVILCLDYIYNNLHTKITLDKLAEVSHMSPTYISRLFHKEVGVTVSDYITRKRIEAAKNMLRYSEHTSIEITECLCFSSESHFIQVFKKHTGCTPKTYREKYFRTRKNREM